MEKTITQIGPYSHYRKAGNTIFISGQLPVDPETGKMADGIKEQAAQALKNISAIMDELKLPISSIVKTTVYIKNMDDFAEMNGIYASFFEKPYPARATIEVSRLARDAKVEIEAIVYQQ